VSRESREEGEVMKRSRAGRGALKLLVAASVCTAAGAAAGSDPDWQAQGRAAVARARDLAADEVRARNVVLFVGDGMGVSTVTAARILDGQLRGEPGEENLLAFERLPHVALAKTYNTNQQVPDSAGTMTALVTGAKTRAGVLSVSAEVPVGDHAAVAGRELRTLFEEAEAKGLATGLVTTTTVTHATPAACYAHSPDRDWENDTLLPPAARAAGFPDIARQLVEFAAGDGLEVALGGGRVHFLPADTADPEYPDRKGARGDGRNLVDAWLARAPGAAFAWSRAQLEAASAGSGPLLGLFEPSHMQWEAHRPRDRAGEPSLAEMTEVAIRRLSRQRRGFVLMVEGGRIDHGHHAGSAHLALRDAVAFSEAVAAALRLLDLDDTLVVVTADHSHVFAIAGYPTRGNPILGLVAENDDRGDPAGELAHDLYGLPYTTLGYLNGPGHTAASDQQPAGAKRFPHMPKRAEPGTAARPDLAATDTAAPGYLQESAIPLSSETHGGEDVPIYAGGPGAALFHGVQEQSYVYHAIRAALGWDAPADAPTPRWWEIWR
jgi:alkaline phosphatase